MYHIAVSLFLTAHIIHISHIACWHSLCLFIRRPRRLSVRAMWTLFVELAARPVWLQSGAEWELSWRNELPQIANDSQQKQQKKVKKRESTHQTTPWDVCARAMFSRKYQKSSTHISAVGSLDQNEKSFVHSPALRASRVSSWNNETKKSSTEKTKRKKSTHDSGDMANEFVRI